MPGFPADASDLTHLLVVADLDRSVGWYRDVLGAEVVGEYGGTSVVLRLVGSCLLLVTGGPPTADKPGVAMTARTNEPSVSAELIISVPDCRSAVIELSSRGATFLADPVEYAWEIRAFLRDPDGHLFELTQRKTGAERPAATS